MEASSGLVKKFTAEQIVTLMSDSLAARLEKLRFQQALNRLREEIGAETSARFLDGSVAARLLSSEFLEVLIALGNQVGNRRLVRELIRKHAVVTS